MRKQRTLVNNFLHSSSGSTDSGVWVKVDYGSGVVRWHVEFEFDDWKRVARSLCPFNFCECYKDYEKLSTYFNARQFDTGITTEDILIRLPRKV